MGLLRLLLSPDMATTAVDTVTAMATAMDMATVTATATDTTATTARGRLMPSLDMATTATMDTVMDMAMATDVATDTAMDTATTVEREQTVCNHDVKSSVEAAMKFCYWYSSHGHLIIAK